MSTMIGDDELLARFVAGEPEAFVTFYRRHLGAILGFFLRRTRDARCSARSSWSASGSAGGSARRGTR
jgi:hypothetical protein